MAYSLSMCLKRYAALFCTYLSVMDKESTCAECGGVLEYDFAQYVSACGDCGAVGPQQGSTLVAEWGQLSNTVVAPVVPVAASGMQKECFERRVQSFSRTAVHVARSTGDEAPGLLADMRELGANALSQYKAVPLGPGLRSAGAAAALLRARRDRRAVSITDVANVAGVTPGSIVAAFEQLVNVIGGKIIRDTADVHLSRYRTAAVKLLGNEEDVWLTVSSRAVTILHILQALWKSQGRNPVCLAAVAVVFAVRAAALDVLAPSIPTVKNCVKNIAIAGGVNERNVRKWFGQLSRDLAAKLDDVEPSQVHAYVDVLYNKLYEVIDGQRRTRTVALPSRHVRGNDARKQRKEVLRSIRDGITKPQSLNSQERAIVALVRAGASKEQVLRGRLVEVASALVNDLKEDDDDEDDDVDDAIRTEREIVMHTSLMAARGESQ